MCKEWLRVAQKRPQAYTLLHALAEILVLATASPQGGAYVCVYDLYKHGCDYIFNELTIHKSQVFKEAMHLPDISSLEVYF